MIVILKPEEFLRKFEEHKNLLVKVDDGAGRFLLVQPGGAALYCSETSTEIKISSLLEIAYGIERIDPSRFRE